MGISRMHVALHCSVVNMSKSCCFAVVLAVICLSVILLSLEADAQPTIDETTSCGDSTLDEAVNMVKIVASNQQENAQEIKEEFKDVKRLLVLGSAQTNETSLEAVVKEMKDEIKNETGLLSNDIKDVKALLASGCQEANETRRLEETLKEMKDDIKSEIKDEVREVKEMITSGCQDTNESRLEDAVKQIKDEIMDVKTLLTSESNETNETCRLEDVVKELKEEIRLLATNQRKTELDAGEPSKQVLVSALVSNCVPLLIQQNINGSNFFNRSWAEFKVGFNDSSGNYWLGNELFSQLTVNNRYKLRFDLQSRSNTSNWYYAEYSTFRVLTEADNYTLLVAGYSGNAGYNAFGEHNGMMFSTYDRDNDRWSSHCAVNHGGGFWYHACYWCNVNGVRWFYWHGLPGGGSLQSSRMWLQCN